MAAFWQARERGRRHDGGADEVARGLSFRGPMLAGGDGTMGILEKIETVYFAL